MNAGISVIKYHLPENEVRNEELARENPDWNMPKIETKAGVYSRRVSGPDETALDLACKACEELFSNGSDPDEIDGIIFCTQSPDYIMPSNAFLLHNRFNFRNNILAYDYNLACSGYIYGLAMASSFISAGLARKILLVNADTYSKYINNRDRSARVVFGDGAAVSIISADSSSGKIIDFEFETIGSGHDKFMIPAGGIRNPKNEKTSVIYKDRNNNYRSDNDILMDGYAIWNFVNNDVPPVVRRLLKKNSLTTEDIDLYIFHQASKLTLDSLTSSLGLPDEKVYRNIDHLGNTVSASVPIALADVIGMPGIKKNSKVLLAGFGVGLSIGTALLQF